MKDANSKIVGIALPPSHVAVNLNGQEVVIQLAKTTGFVEDAMFGNFLFANPDCTGDAFPDGQVFNAESALTYAIQVFRGTVYYPAEPLQFGTPRAALAQTDPSLCTQGGGMPVSSDLCCEPCCALFNELPVLRQFDLTTLGLVPPFHVEGP